MAVRISAYGYCNRMEQYDAPYLASIRSFVSLCAPTGGEVVILTDPRFTDGTRRQLLALAEQLPKLRVIDHEWQLDEPGCDGLEKAEARRIAAEGPPQVRGDITVPEVLVPFDVDEVIHEKDLKRCRELADEMVGRGWRVVSCGTIPWRNGPHVKLSDVIYKPRLTLNDDFLTHGIPKSQEVIFPNGKRGGTQHTDGAGLLDTRTQEGVEGNFSACAPHNVRHDSIQETEVDRARYVHSLLDKTHVHIHHYSWFDIPRKWAQDQTWWYLWKNLRGEYPNGLDDYKTFKDEDEPVEFWAEMDARRATSAYESSIIDEMSKPDVVRLDWLSHPKCVQEWVDSPDRRVWLGLRGKGKETALERPVSWWKTPVQALRDRFQPGWDF